MIKPVTDEILLFQHDLKNGMSIDDALIKHGLNFLDVWHRLHYKPRADKKTRPVHSTGEKYITRQDERKYVIRKQIGNKYIYFGGYETLEDAITMRNWLLENQWDKTRWKAQRRRLGI